VRVTVLSRALLVVPPTRVMPYGHTMVGGREVWWPSRSWRCFYPLFGEPVH
jgi:hypothetical protein